MKVLKLSMLLAFSIFLGSAVSAQTLSHGMPATGGKTTSPYGKYGTAPRHKKITTADSTHHGTKKNMHKGVAVKPKSHIVTVDDGTQRP